MIEAGEYVRTVDGKIAIFDRYSSRKETSIYKSPFNCFIKLSNRKTPLQCHRDFIVNHSKNIIDLIETGDLINRSEVYGLGQTDNGQKWIHTCNGYLYFEKDLLGKTILTKEMYEANCYTVERN